MLACQFALFLLPLLLLLQLGIRPVLAVHSTCSWKPTPGSPANIGYRRWCLAKPEGTSYQCHEGLYIADLNAKSAKLEWRELRAARGETVFKVKLKLTLPPRTDSPCGDEGGYAKRPEGSCPSSHWALCLNGVNPAECYFMASGDDCTCRRDRLEELRELTARLFAQASGHVP